MQNYIVIMLKECFDDMTDEEQLAMALQMSLQSEAQAMETDDVDAGQQPSTSKEENNEAQENAEFDELAQNREFLQVWLANWSLLLQNIFTQEALSNIEGVNPQNALQILDKMSEKKDDNKWTTFINTVDCN